MKRDIKITSFDEGLIEGTSGGLHHRNDGSLTHSLTHWLKPKTQSRIIGIKNRQSIGRIDLCNDTGHQQQQQHATCPFF